MTMKRLPGETDCAYKTRMLQQKAKIGQQNGGGASLFDRARQNARRR